MTDSEAGRTQAARRASRTAFLLNGTVFGVWATHIPAIKAHLDLSAAVLGTALLCLAVGALTAMVASGPLLGRLGSAPVTRATALAFAGLLPLPSLMPDVASLCAALFLFGAAGGTMDVAMNAQGALVERRLGRPVMSSLHGMWSLGGLTGAGAGGLLLPLLPAPVQAGLVAAVLLALFLATQSSLLPDRESAGEGGLALPDRGTLLLGAMAMLAFMSEGAILDWSAIYLREDLESATALAGFGFAIFSGAMALCRFFGDRLRQKVGAVALVRAGGLLAAGGLALALLGGTPALALVGFGLTGIGLSNIVPVLFSAAGAAEEGPGKISAARSIAAVSTLGYTGVLAGPALLGFVAEASSVGASFGLVAALILAITAMARRGVRVPARPL
ncbi:MFS transporter [Azospirillum agricola]|uniref:MFS transporter n=1 Tax=Azospirillum agricola TaxID=1720247 RepID=UPI000A0F2A27|nr:MFS transporter [Azospirillum agricola]SMH54885.1 Major Facilitator Superfamily protein [Azospirillum lipoferum]